MYWNITRTNILHLRSVYARVLGWFDPLCTNGWPTAWCIKSIRGRSFTSSCQLHTLTNCNKHYFSVLIPAPNFTIFYIICRDFPAVIFDSKFLDIVDACREIFNCLSSQSTIASRRWKFVEKITASENKLWCIFVVNAIKELSEARQAWRFGCVRMFLSL